MLTPKERSKTPEGKAWQGAHSPYNPDAARAERQAARERKDWPICPRCGVDPLEPWGGAQSRLATERDQWEICSWCGTHEAMLDFAGVPPIPPDEWPIVREVEDA